MVLFDERFGFEDTNLRIVATLNPILPLNMASVASFDELFRF